MRLVKLSLIDKVRWWKKPNDRPEKAGAAVSEFEFEFLFAVKLYNVSMC